MKHNHETTITSRIRYSEVDSMGFVYYAHYCVFLEVGRTEWLRSRGFSYREMEENGFFLPVVDLKIRYHKAARYDDLIETITTAAELTKRVIRFSYRIVRERELLIEAETTHLFMNRSGRAGSLPQELFNRITRDGAI
ncbi:MAG: thioesterase family protein [Candidatus Wallbacteria bacterium]|nr:thioesterase family protein [Candidatus Wallbacteria bacterium]